MQLVGDGVDHEGARVATADSHAPQPGRPRLPRAEDGFTWTEHVHAGRRSGHHHLQRLAPQRQHLRAYMQLTGGPREAKPVWLRPVAASIVAEMHGEMQGEMQGACSRRDSATTRSRLPPLPPLPPLPWATRPTPRGSVKQPGATPCRPTTPGGRKEMGISRAISSEHVWGVRRGVSGEVSRSALGPHGHLGPHRG